MKARLNWFDLVSINIFWLGLNIRNNAVGTILLPYLLDAFVQPEVRNTALGTVRTAGLIIAMLAQPAFGLLSDRSTSRFGRRRPYIFVGVLFDLVCLALFLVAENFGFLLGVILIQQLAANISHGPLQGLIPDLVPEAQRGVASAWKSIFELLPIVVLGFTIAPLVGAGRVDLAVLVTGLGLLVTMLLTMFLVKEKPIKLRPDLALGPPMLRVLGMLAGILLGGLIGVVVGGLVGGFAGLIAWPVWGRQVAMDTAIGIGGITAMAVAVIAGVWSGVYATLGSEARQQSPFTWWVVNRLMFLAAITSVQGYAAFFLMYSFNTSREDAAVMTGNLFLVVGACTILTTLPSGWLSDRFGQKRIVGLSGLLAAVAMLFLMATAWLHSLALVYAGGVLLGLATGLFVTTNWALGTRLVPLAQAGRYLGISNLAGAGAGMIGSGLGGPVADWLNASLPGLGYFTIFAGYGVLFLLSTASLRRIREEVQTT